MIRPLCSIPQKETVCRVKTVSRISQLMHQTVKISKLSGICKLHNLNPFLQIEYNMHQTLKMAEFQEFITGQIKP